MRQPTKLIEDQTGRRKLEVSLPGGRYQLSLHDSAINFLCDDIGLTIGDSVSMPIVRVLVATRDAWFPRHRDSESVVNDLPTDGTLSQRERHALIDFLQSIAVSPRDIGLVKQVIEESPVSDVIDPEDIGIKSLPLADSDLLPGQADTDDSVSTSGKARSENGSKKPVSDNIGVVEEAEEREGDELGEITAIPGIGPKRGSALWKAGYTKIEEIAEARPVDIARATNFGEQMATVAVEGAREMVGHRDPTAARLSAETGVPEGFFDGSLSQLAAAGVPPSEAASTLRVIYGRSLAEIDSITGQQAYFLWEAGYRTVRDVVEAGKEELCDVYSIGESTVETLLEDASKVVDQTESSENEDSNDSDGNGEAVSVHCPVETCPYTGSIYQVLGHMTGSNRDSHSDSESHACPIEGCTFGGALDSIAGHIWYKDDSDHVPENLVKTPLFEIDRQQ